MHRFIRSCLLLVFVTAATAQVTEPPLSDTRLTVHTLLREDVFAGFLTNDLARLSRAERNIELLLQQRPAAKPELLAWQGGATLYRAVVAFENRNDEEFQKKYKLAQDLFSQARQLGPGNLGVAAVTGGSYVIHTDRLPLENRRAGWSQAYDAYQALWKQQAPALDTLPLHMKGELLAGLAQSAQRTGRMLEMEQFLDKMLTTLRDTPYETVARQWKADPDTAAKTSIACKSCHDSGRLASRLASLNKD